MSPAVPSQELTMISTHERATPALVYRALLKSIRDGRLVPGGRLPNERMLAEQFRTSRTAVRSALAMMERQALVQRRVGSGTYLTEDALRIFERMDQTSTPRHDDVPSFIEIAEGRLLFEPAMMHLVVSRADPADIAAMRGILGNILDASTWHRFKECIYQLHRRTFAATKNRFLVQIMENILADRRAVAFDGRDVDKPVPDAVRRQTHDDLAAIVGAIASRNAKLAESLTADHLMRTIATINIWR
jgi:DNA-binding FadR family transcriptional regulator